MEVWGIAWGLLVKYVIPDEIRAEGKGDILLFAEK
jgi:hypothetical protein